MPAGGARGLVATRMKNTWAEVDRLIALAGDHAAVDRKLRHDADRRSAAAHCVGVRGCGALWEC